MRKIWNKKEAGWNRDSSGAWIGRERARRERNKWKCRREEIIDGA